MPAQPDRRPRVIIVGAGYAGLTAAHRFAGKAEVTVVAPSDRFVDRIRLHQFAAGTCTEEQVAPVLHSVLPSDAVHIVGSAVTVLPGKVILLDGRELTADHIVVAAGSGLGAGVTNLESSRQVRTELEGLAPGSVVQINGAGHTGVELAAELAEQRPDLRITLIDPAGLLPRVSVRARRKASRHLKSAGITVTDLMIGLPTPDLIVDCTGFAAPSINGLSAPDDTLSFGLGLWTAGDIAATGHRWSCAAAEPMGAHVADNIIRVSNGGEPQPFRFGYAIQCISLGRHRGIVQLVRADDNPRRLVLSGAGGAFVKERISRKARRVATGAAKRYTWPTGPLMSEVQHRAVV